MRSTPTALVLAAGLGTGCGGAPTPPDPAAEVKRVNDRLNRVTFPKDRDEAELRAVLSEINAIDTSRCPEDYRAAYARAAAPAPGADHRGDRPLPADAGQVHELRCPMRRIAAYVCPGLEIPLLVYGFVENRASWSRGDEGSVPRAVLRVADVLQCPLFPIAGPP